MPPFTVARKALARLVAKLQLLEDQLKKIFTTKKDDKKALRKALQTAKNAGLTFAFSVVVRDVEEFLGKVIMAACKPRLQFASITVHEKYAVCSPTSSHSVRILVTRTPHYQRKKKMSTPYYQ